MPLARGPYRGRCRGGPWDGKDIEHDQPIYRVPVMPPFSLRQSFEPLDKPVELKWGSYFHVLGQWIWRDE